jgi:hypothetical protein
VTQLVWHAWCTYGLGSPSVHQQLDMPRLLCTRAGGSSITDGICTTCCALAGCPRFRSATMWLGISGGVLMTVLMMKGTRVSCVLTGQAPE